MRVQVDNGMQRMGCKVHGKGLERLREASKALTPCGRANKGVAHNRAHRLGEVDAARGALRHGRDAKVRQHAAAVLAQQNVGSLCAQKVCV